jgi:hypothetical protein
MNTAHIDISLAKIRALFEETSEVIEALKPGEKIPATKLAQQIAERHGMTGPGLYPVLKFLFEGYPGFEVKRGAQGGICRLPVETKEEVKEETK